jgi:uncharacterized Zn finger protein (UPF0148 family)
VKITCRNCGHDAPTHYWILRAGELFCPICQQAEDPRIEALLRLEEEGQEEAQTDLFHESKS